MSVLAGPDPRDRFSLPAGDDDWAHCTDGGIQGFRVAYSPDWGYAAVDPQVRAVVGDAVEVFERELGCTVERVEPGWPHPYEAFWAIVANESDLRGLRAMVERLGAEYMTPHVLESIRTEWTAEQLTDALPAAARTAAASENPRQRDPPVEPDGNRPKAIPSSGVWGRRTRCVAVPPLSMVRSEYARG